MRNVRNRAPDQERSKRQPGRDWQVGQGGARHSPSLGSEGATRPPNVAEPPDTSTCQGPKGPNAKTRMKPRYSGALIGSRVYNYIETLSKVTKKLEGRGVRAFFTFRIFMSGDCQMPRAVRRPYDSANWGVTVTT